MARTLLWNLFQNPNGWQRYVEYYSYLRATSFSEKRQTVTFSRRHLNG